MEMTLQQRAIHFLRWRRRQQTTYRGEAGSSSTVRKRIAEKYADPKPLDELFGDER